MYLNFILIKIQNYHGDHRNLDYDYDHNDYYDHDYDYLNK